MRPSFTCNGGAGVTAPVRQPAVRRIRVGTPAHFILNGTGADRLDLHIPV